MPDAAKISVAEWWKFERETISAAWKSTDKKSSAIWSLTSGVMMAFLQFNEGFKSQHETLVSILNILGVAAVVLLAQFLFNLLRSAAVLSKIDREKLVQQANESGIKEKQFQKQIEAQNEKLDERARRKSVAAKLGNYQEKLNQRYDKIRGMANRFWVYANENEHFFELKAFDPETQLLLEEIERFLKTEMEDAVADFTDTINLQFTPVSPTAELRAKLVYWQLIVDHLKHRTKQMAKIKADYIANNHKNNSI